MDETYKLEELGAPSIRAAATLIGALSRRDGLITADELQAAALSGLALSSISDNPILVDVLVMHSLVCEEISYSEAVKELARVAAGFSAEARLAIFKSYRPLLALQGTDARRLGVELAQILKVDSKTQAIELAQVPGDAPNFVGRFRTALGWPLASDADVRVDTARAWAHRLGDERLLRLAEQGASTLPAHDLRAAVLRARDAVERTLPSDEGIVEREVQAQRVQSSAKKLARLAESRIRAAERRVALQRRMFREDVESFVSRSIDAIELGMRNLLDARDDFATAWTEETLWKRFADSEVATRFQAEYGPLRARYDAMFQIWNDETREFGEEAQATVSDILADVDRSIFRDMVPTTHRIAAAKGLADAVADATVRAGVTAGLATSGLILTGVLSAGAVTTFVVAHPVVWVGAAAIGLAAAWKAFANPRARGRAVVQDKREAIKATLLRYLDDPVVKHDKALDEIQAQYRRLFQASYEPMLRDAWLDVKRAELMRTVKRQLQAQFRTLDAAQ